MKIPYKQTQIPVVVLLIVRLCLYKEQNRFMMLIDLIKNDFPLTFSFFF